ncbi:uncharacterized protein LOC131882601 [Tigriopus californicus]|uniref:uncharacterized protein LOC131882601 n=1 Tax=Tigriopus californicus TaxID=6832 RepID=UPI0027DA2863|nr:uncharacterized protein LOC131882601 [Tigriopus californicus]|eukprot:TCALIF_06203-PA protein Name:"Similar to Pogz Pogo transposable element with ZNF domain (Mus musculus)" AED:0.02 eAED:0.02 QI:510/1/1/1/1/1/9/72/1414
MAGETGSSDAPVATVSLSDDEEMAEVTPPVAQQPTGTEANGGKNATPIELVRRPGPASQMRVRRDVPLFMSCDDDPLTEVQANNAQRLAREFGKSMKKLENLAAAGARITPQENGQVQFRVTTTTTVTNASVSSAAGPRLPVLPSVPLTLPRLPVGLPPNNGPTPLTPVMAPSSFRYLLDPRTGRILGTINTSTAHGATTNVLTSLPNSVSRAPLPVRMGGTRMVMSTPRLPGPRMSTPRLTSPRLSAAVPHPPLSAPGPRASASYRARRPVPHAVAIRSGAPPVPPRPTAPQPPVVDLTESAPAADVPQSRSDRTKHPFPALAVTPKPQKMVQNPSAKRSELDVKVKSLLVYSPAKFTEWLIQMGLVPSEQYATSPHGQPFKLKLGMYSDSKKFPHSGGYVWISEKHLTATAQLVSVFRGSIFELTTQPPMVVLKLIYHWCCQTNIQNVVQWVKVDQATVSQYYQALRGVCTATVHDEVSSLGGPGKSVEIGVISLGTTSSDGCKREVKVEVLGILDRHTGCIRLRATEPAKNVTLASRFAQIFKPLPIWINQNSHIVTDFSIDRQRLKMMGFTIVTQNATTSPKRAQTNIQIMEYLKKVVPKMFQNTLSVLSTNTIQQFLDELSFREVIAHYPLLSFNTIISKISDVTAIARTQNTTFSARIKEITDEPFRDWRMSTVRPPSKPSGIDSGPGNGLVEPNSKRTPLKHPAITQLNSNSSGNNKRKSSSVNSSEEVVAKKPKSSNKPEIDMESFYYGTIEGASEILSGEFKADMVFKCHLCKKIYMNNIEFMKHLSLHVESERAAAVDLVDLCQCKYCFKDFDTPFGLQTHLDRVHFMKGFEFVCRICDQGFETKPLLLAHMEAFHVGSELPYGCHICAYRSSFHRDVIDHFQESHDRTDKLQCPRCLKTFTLCSDKGYSSNVAVSFVQHLQEHQDKKLTCKKCCLTFLKDGSMRKHIERDHASYRSFEKLERYTYMGNETPLKIPKPIERNVRLAVRKPAWIKSVQQQTAFAGQNLEDLIIYDVESENCSECGVKLVQKSHFTAYLCCTKCRFSTCCAKSMSAHVEIFHKSPGKPEFTLGVPCIQSKDMYCCCGFKSPSGNKMAKHLALNGCLSAYPSREVAKKARKGRSSASHSSSSSSWAVFNKVSAKETDDDDDKIESYDPNEVMAKAYLKPLESKEEKKPSGQEGPLAFLGLQRKPSMDDEESNSKTDVDSIRLSNAHSSHPSVDEDEETAQGQSKETHSNSKDKPSPFDELLVDKQSSSGLEDDSNPAKSTSYAEESKASMNPLHDMESSTFDEDSQTLSLEPSTFNGVNEPDTHHEEDDILGSFHEDSNTSLRTPNPPSEDMDPNTFDDLRSTNDNLNGGTSGDLESALEDWNEDCEMEPLTLENDDDDDDQGDSSHVEGIGENASL